jgi:hypothetical protein
MNDAVRNLWLQSFLRENQNLTDSAIPLAAKQNKVVICYKIYRITV